MSVRSADTQVAEATRVMSSLWGRTGTEQGQARPLFSSPCLASTPESDSTAAERGHLPLLKSNSSSHVGMQRHGRVVTCHALTCAISLSPNIYLGGCVHFVGEEIKAQRVRQLSHIHPIGQQWGQDCNPGPPLSDPASYLLLESDPGCPGVICKVRQLLPPQTRQGCPLWSRPPRASHGLSCGPELGMASWGTNVGDTVYRLSTHSFLVTGSLSACSQSCQDPSPPWPQGFRQRT